LADEVEREREGGSSWLHDNYSDSDSGSDEADRTDYESGSGSGSGSDAYVNTSTRTRTNASIDGLLGGQGERKPKDKTLRILPTDLFCWEEQESLPLPLPLPLSGLPSESASAQGGGGGGVSAWSKRGSAALGPTQSLSPEAAESGILN